MKFDKKNTGLLRSARSWVLLGLTLIGALMGTPAASLGVAQQPVTYPLEIDVVSPSPTAQIQVTPSPGFGPIPCPPPNANNCTTQYQAGTQVTVTATSGVPVLGHNWQFAQYVAGPVLGTNIGPPIIVSGCVLTTNTCTFNMPASPLEVHVEITDAPHPADPTADLGDAPDRTNNWSNAPMTAYLSVPANFPTVFNSNPPGPKHLQPKTVAWLGPNVSCENEADQPPDCDVATNIDPTTPSAIGTPDRDGFDDGLTPLSTLPACGQIKLNYTLSTLGSAATTQLLYVNVWLDYNRDGDWEDSFKCPLGPATTGLASEWAVQNQLIPASTLPATLITPLFTAANLDPGKDIWVRITLSEQPAPPAPNTLTGNPDGRGPTPPYRFGETEDYLWTKVGLPPTAEICGIKWNDLDGDGQYEPGPPNNEPGLPNWTIGVKDQNGIVVAMATTDPNGQYCVVVSAGTYTVSEVPQQGWTQTFPSAPGTHTVTVPPSVTNTNFGNKQPTGKAEICAFKFEDLDGDGVKDPNEPLLGGWTFNVNPGPPNQVTTTPQGGICFGVTAPGTYTITEVIPPPPPTWTPTTPTSQTVTVQPSQLVNVFFGNKKKGECDLAIRKSVSPNPVPSGQQVTITLTVQNVGTGPCGPDTIVQDLPTTGLTIPSQTVAISQSGGSAVWFCNVIGGGASCVTASTLPAGYQATFTFTATVTAPPGSTIQNCAMVTNSNDTNTTNNHSCVTVSVTGGKCDLAIKKSISPSPLVSGQPFTVTITMMNAGTGPCSPGVITMTDALPQGLKVASVAQGGSQWNCSVTGANPPATVTCTWNASAQAVAPSGPLPSITINGTVTAPPGTAITNCATVSNPPYDTNLANNQSCVTVKVQ